MVQVIIVWVYASFIFFSLGYGLIQLLNKLNIKDYLDLEYYIFLGIISVTTLASYFSIFLPTGLTINVFLLTISVIILVINKKSYFSYLFAQFESLNKLSKHYWILFIAILCYALIKSAGPGEIYDDNLYYLQTIHWIENYPAIPGLANLHGRLGFNSSWHLLSAVFSFSFLGCHYFNDLNGYLFILIAFTSIKSLFNIYKSGFNIFDGTQVCMTLFILYFLKDYFSAPTADLPATIFCWIVFNLFLKFIIRFGENKDLNYSEIFIITLTSIFCLTIKVSIAPICLFILYLIFILFSRKLYKMIFCLMVVSFVVIAPFIIRNIIQTGYLVYPIAITGIDGLDWKVPLFRPNSISDNFYGTFSVKEEIGWIKSWAKLPNRYFKDVNNMAINEWLPQWYEAQNRDNLKLIHLLGIAILFYVVFKSMFFKYWFLVITIYIGVSFWFLSAPDFRFGYGFIGYGAIFSVCVFLFVLYNKLRKINKYFLNRAVFIYVIYFWSSYSVKNINEISEIKSIFVKNCFVPSRFYEVNNTNSFKIGKTNIYNPVERDWCGYEPFPCTPYQNPLLIMRNDRIENGFKIKYY